MSRLLAVLSLSLAALTAIGCGEPTSPPQPMTPSERQKLMDEITTKQVELNQMSHLLPVEQQRWQVRKIMEGTAVVRGVDGDPASRYDLVVPIKNGVAFKENDIVRLERISDRWIATKLAK